MESKHLIVVSVVEGRNIIPLSTSGPQYAFIEARFNGEILSSDPVPLHNTCPQFLTELCWELDRKCLHLFRIERKPIKLMCYLLSSDSLQKHFIGYIVLDIRLAQEVSKQKFEWRPLLNNKYRGPSHQRPELYLSIQLVKSDENKEECLTIPNVDQVVGTSLQEISESHSKKNQSDDQYLENDIKVKLLNGRYHIWDSKKDNGYDLRVNFKISVTILVKFPAKLEEQLMFHFNVNLFGASIMTESFTDLRSCEIPIERISFKVTTKNASTLGTYFELNPTLEIQLCDNKNELLGFVTILLNRLYNSKEGKFQPIESQFRLLPYDDSIGSDPPHPNIGVIVEVEEETESAQTKDLPMLGDEYSREPSSSQQHYYFAVDIRSMSFSEPAILPLKKCFVQYSYAFFGFLDKVKTSVVAVDHISTVVFEEGFCAFNFATSESQLKQTLRNVPLVLEVVDESSVNTLLGTAKIYLSDILNVPQDNEGKKVLSFDVPVLNSIKDKIGDIQVIMCLQNWGEAKIGQLSNDLTQRNRTEDSKLSNSSLNIDVLLMEAALEIEMWKEQQITIFTEELKRKEKEYFHQLDKKLSQKSSTNDDELKAKMAELLKLEERLKTLIESVNNKERNLDSKENELSEKQTLLKARFEKLDSEISEAINEMRSNFEEKYNEAKDKLKASQEDKSKLQQKIYSLEKKLKEKEETIKNLESKVKGTAKSTVTRSRKSVGENEFKSVSKDKNNIYKSRTRSVDGQKEFKASNQTANRGEVSANARKTLILAQIKKEKEELLKNGIREDDPIIKEIDAQLQKHGFKLK
ncbi:DUF3668 domain-containing protein-like protein [Dinothrombium tinctorium]|uniref:DUF3668 domain-containing protein-like protein n=1 Tax=Dinothrombium tinctorium TaxID=1965070 RepID=A0A443RMH8_9ACAR|nr:DUF3668 domain-containing protein-like protein [Dinothrombium tinctorium]